MAIFRSGLYVNIIGNVYVEGIFLKARVSFTLIGKAEHGLSLSELLLHGSTSINNGANLPLHLSLVLDIGVFLNVPFHLLDIFDLDTRYHLLNSLIFMFNVCILGQIPNVIRVLQLLIR